MKMLTNKSVNILFVCLFMILCASCNKTETQMVKWIDKQSGLKEWEKTKDNGITKIVYYYESGMKKKEEHFKGLERHGKSYQWYENGLLEFDKTFEYGVKVGDHKRYYDNGKLSGNQFYDMGTKSGTWKFYLIGGKEWMSESYNKGSLISSERINVFGLK